MSETLLQDPMLKSACGYYWGDGEKSMSDAAWDALSRHYCKYRHQYDFLHEIDYKSGSMFYVKREQFEYEFKRLGVVI